MGETYDFSGWATRNDLKCSDGRTIRQDAFIDNDGQTVPLVWQHLHDEPVNVLGHALLKNEKEGVRAFGKFNNTDAGQLAKELVENGDIKSLSIYANKLKQKGGDVLHGQIREVSLVLAGANPGAYIDYPILAHGDEEEADEAVIYTGFDIALSHADGDDPQEEEPAQKEKTVKDVFDEFTDEQKNVVYFMIGQALEDAGVSDEEEDDEEIEHSDDKQEEEEMADEKTVKDVFDELTDEQKNVVYFMIGQALEDAGVSGDEAEEGEEMKHNVFDNEYDGMDSYLSHSDMEAIFADAKRLGSLKDAVEEHLEGGVLAHVDDGIEYSTGNQQYFVNQPDFLFPEARALNNPPEWIKRNTDWVSTFMSGVHHTPFSRIKSVYANITEDEARAKGYMKGKMKKEEFFTLLKRTTTPQTVYKKQKMDRDDMIDITDFDVVAWLKGEMRIMLDEEIARAALIGDGRPTSSDDHISEEHIRPIWKDADLFSVKLTVAQDTDPAVVAKNFITTAIRGRKQYKGSGNPTLFTTEEMLTEMLLLEDKMGRPMYETEAALATKLRVSKIVTVEVMENQTRDGKKLAGIIVNLNDYNIGADRGGEVNMFDDFDIDYNQQKYLIETRCSGALTKPYSALVLEIGTASGNDGE